MSNNNMTQKAMTNGVLPFLVSQNTSPFWDKTQGLADYDW